MQNLLSKFHLFRNNLQFPWYEFNLTGEQTYLHEFPWYVWHWTIVEIICMIISFFPFEIWKSVLNGQAGMCTWFTVYKYLQTCIRILIIILFVCLCSVFSGTREIPGKNTLKRSSGSALYMYVCLVCKGMTLSCGLELITISLKDEWFSHLFVDVYTRVDGYQDWILDHMKK